MRHVLSALVLSLLISPAVLAEDDNSNEMKASMDAFAEVFAGTWVQERVLDNDLPGIAEKGDTLVAHITFTPKDGLILVDWKGEVNGKPAGATAKGLMGWDAAQKKLRMRWFTTAGSSGTATYRQQGKRWVAQGRYLQADGQKGPNRGMYRFKGKDTYVVEVSNRKQGEETQPEREDTWKRESKLPSGARRSTANLPFRPPIR